MARAQNYFLNFAATLPPTCLKCPVCGHNRVVADGWQCCSKIRNNHFHERRKKNNPKTHPQISRINIWWSKELCVPLWAIIKKTQNKTLTE